MAVDYILLGNGGVTATFLADTVAAGRRLPILVVLNTPDRQREGAAIRAFCEGHDVPVAAWGTDCRRDLLAHPLRGDAWLLSVYFGHILDADVLEAFGGRAVNLHPSYLPWNRGANTNVWPLLDGTPAGVSLHQMLPRVDSGPVLFREEEPVHPWDTAESLYLRLETRGLGLLMERWPGDVVRVWPGDAQPDEGTFHRRNDMDEIAFFDLDSDAGARRFFDLLRARTYPPFEGLMVRVDGQFVDAKIVLEPKGGRG